MYHIAFQLLGDIWMLLGLLVMAFAPMATWHQFCPAPSDGMDDPFSAKCGNPPHDSTSSNGKVVQPGLKLSYAQSEVYLGLGTYYSITRPLTDEAITQVMVRPLDCTGAEDHR